MQILIIGCNGFIGSNLLKNFKRAGNTTVFGCDIQEGNRDPAYFCIAREDKGFDSIFQKTGFDFCINCSGAANVHDSLKNPLYDYQLNTVNVFKMLDAIRQHQPSCRFLNLSSAAVYGNPAKLPIREADAVLPVSPYGLHKFQAEQICREFFNYWEIGTCSVRIFSAYGPGLKKQLFWDLYQKSLGKNEVSLFGSGAETRDFIFIEDIVQAIKLVMEGSAFEGETINVANGQECGIKEAVQIFYDALGWNGVIQFKGEVRKGDPLNWRADISKLKELGYRQSFPLQAGLTAYAKWLKESE
jgi:dTDP-glucose 4,6-dehydratase/UDP-glucose 4-epimerase